MKPDGLRQKIIGKQMSFQAGVTESKNII